MKWTGFLLALLFLVIAGQPSLVMAQSGGAFTPTGSMTTPRMLHSATLLADGRVLIAGGMIGGGTIDVFRGMSDGVFFRDLASAELYDPGTGTFTAIGDMTTPRIRHTATLLPDGRVLIAGGGPRGGSLSIGQAELYDPSTGRFTVTGDMTEPRSAHAATLLANGKVLLAGGFQRVVEGLEARSLASAELYDPSTGIFTATGSMTTTLADTATLLPNGNVLITGYGTITAEIYDPSTGRFTPTAGLIASHAGPTATLLANGKVLVAGGDMGDGDGGTNIAEIYDSGAGTFTLTGNMTRGREQHIAALLSDGTVLLAGDHFGPPGGGLNRTVSAELYDPVTGAFRHTGDMVTGRELHTATLLPSGGVLIAGGDEYWPLALATAELYNPQRLTPAPVLLSLPGDSRGQGAILHAGTAQVASSSNPAAAGEVLEVYCTGLAGSVPPQVAIGGRMAEILYFGRAPGFNTLNQVNVRVPSGIAPGPSVPMRLTYLGRPSNEVTIGVR